MKQHVHYIGIGGIGMSALARWHVAKGWTVSGSDMEQSAMTDALRAEGIDVSIGHAARNVPRDAARIIYSAAVRSDNSEMKSARAQDIPIMKYAEALGELTKQHITFAVAGTHGKSTTAALLSLMLIRAGLDPTVIVGTRLAEFGGKNMRVGAGRYLVIEADEYDRSFWHYFPTVAVVTNVDADHLDTYGTMSGVIAGFRHYLRALPQGATAIINAGDPQSVRAARGIACRAVMFNKGGKISARWPLKIPGHFNQVNAEAAYQAAKIAGVSKKIAQDAVRAYRGSWRRMEMLKPRNGEYASSSIFFSDYAHHPREIMATIGALRERYPRRKIAVVFEPHQRKRLTLLFRDFVVAFDAAHRVLFLPTYQVAGREQKSGKTAENLYAAVARRRGREGKKTVFCLKKFEEARTLMGGQVVVFMGAGAIDGEARKYFTSKLMKSEKPA